MKGKVLAVVGIMVGLYAIDKSLASLEAREVNAQAAGFYLEGQKLLSGGHAAAAVDDFRRAHTLERTNRNFDFALASAELTAGRTEDAEATLTELLDRNTNDARVNLLMARVRVVEGRFDDAVAFYHRAIYGVWTDGSEADKTGARLELAEQLAKRGRREELLSELLLLDREGQKDPKLAKKLAGLYLEAGSAQRAEAAYRELVRMGRLLRRSGTRSWCGWRTGWRRSTRLRGGWRRRRSSGAARRFCGWRRMRRWIA